MLEAHLATKLLDDWRAEHLVSSMKTMEEVLKQCKSIDNIPEQSQDENAGSVVGRGRLLPAAPRFEELSPMSGPPEAASPLASEEDDDIAAFGGILLSSGSSVPELNESPAKKQQKVARTFRRRNQGAASRFVRLLFRMMQRCPRTTIRCRSLPRLQISRRLWFLAWKPTRKARRF